MNNKVFAKGAYGCLLFPYVTCKGGITNNYRFISKIVRKNFYALNEIEIGAHIRKQFSTLWENFFVPAIYHCDINISKFSHIDLDKCDIVKKYKKSPFMLLKIPFIGYKKYYISYQDYVVQDINAREIVLNLIDGYRHLLSALLLLQEDSVKICHFDLNESNILFSEDKTVPVIIDFNLSFTPEIILKNLKKFFFMYVPDYFTWPLEVHYINFLLYENSMPTHADIVRIASEYVKYNQPLQNNFSKKFLKDYEDLCVDVLEQYRGGTYEILDIIHKYWRTWDNYALSIMYLRILYYLNISFKNNTPVQSFVPNPFTSHFAKLLLMNIHPNPTRRYGVQETKRIFDSFFYNEDVNDVGNFQQILTQFSSNKDNLEQIVTEDKYKLQKLLKRIGYTRTRSIS